MNIAWIKGIRQKFRKIINTVGNAFEGTFCCQSLLTFSKTQKLYWMAKVIPQLMVIYAEQDLSMKSDKNASELIFISAMVFDRPVKKTAVRRRWDVLDISERYTSM